MGSKRECIIHEHHVRNPASARIRLVLAAWMSWRVPRIRQARPILTRCSCRLCLGLQPEPGRAPLVARPRVFRAPEQGVAPGLRPADLVDGLVGVPDHMELVDHLGGVGQVSADALGEPRAHVAGDRCHPVRVTVVVHEIQREPFDGVRVLAGHHADHVALRRTGEHGDAPVAFMAGPVDADRLHARVIPVQAGPVHIMSDEPPRSRVMFADLPGHVRDRPAFRRLHDHRLEQQWTRCLDGPTAPAPHARRARGMIRAARPRG